MMKNRKKREQSVPGVGGMGLVPMGSQGKFLCSCDTWAEIEEGSCVATWAKSFLSEGKKE